MEENIEIDKSKLKPGDIVFLNSGGPAMTINHISTDGDEITCLWFLNDKSRGEAIFNVKSLNKANN